MSVTPEQELAAVEAHINDKANAIRRRRAYLSSNYVPTINDRALADMESDLETLYQRKRALWVAIETNAKVQELHRTVLCAAPGCHRRPVTDGLCGHHNNTQTYRPEPRWTPEEDAQLIAMRRRGVMYRDIASLMDRSVGATKRRYSTLNSARNRQGAA